MINPSWLVCEGTALKLSTGKPMHGIQVLPTEYLGPRPSQAPAQHVPIHAQPVPKPSHTPKVIQPRNVFPRGSVAAASSSAAQPPRVIPARIIVIKVEEKARPRQPRQPIQQPPAKARPQQAPWHRSATRALVKVGHRKPKHNMSSMQYGKFAVGESLTRYMRGMYRREMKAKRLAEQTPQRRCQTNSRRQGGQIRAR
jgi:hypothetical protein